VTARGTSALMTIASAASAELYLRKPPRWEAHATTQGQASQLARHASSATSRTYGARVPGRSTARTTQSNVPSATTTTSAGSMTSLTSAASHLWRRRRRRRQQTAAACCGMDNLRCTRRCARLPVPVDHQRTRWGTLQRLSRTVLAGCILRRAYGRITALTFEPNV
jgi:hypothetical protein